MPTMPCDSCGSWVNRKPHHITEGSVLICYMCKGHIPDHLRCEASVKTTGDRCKLHRHKKHSRYCASHKHLSEEV